MTNLSPLSKRKRTFMRNQINEHRFTRAELLGASGLGEPAVDRWLAGGVPKPAIPTLAVMFRDILESRKPPTPTPPGDIAAAMDARIQRISEAHLSDLDERIARVVDERIEELLG